MLRAPLLVGNRPNTQGDEHDGWGKQYGYGKQASWSDVTGLLTELAGWDTSGQAQGRGVWRTCIVVLIHYICIWRGERTENAKVKHQVFLGAGLPCLASLFMINLNDGRGLSMMQSASYELLAVLLLGIVSVNVNVGTPGMCFLRWCSTNVLCKFCC